MEAINGLTAGQLKFLILDFESQIEIHKKEHLSLQKKIQIKNNLYEYRIEKLRNTLFDLQDDIE